MTEVFELLKSPIHGNNIIDASAGTGKTYSIEGIYIRFLLRSFLAHLEEKQQLSLRVENILVVTFTEAATAELRTRILEKIRKTLSGVELAQEYLGEAEETLQSAIKERLGLDQFLTDLTLEIFKVSDSETLKKIENTLKLAIFSFDEASIFTIHAFCRKMLVDFALESKTEFNAEFLTDQTSLIEETVYDFWRTQAYSQEKIWAEFFLNEFPSPDKIVSFFSTAVGKTEVRILPEVPPTTPTLLDKIHADFQKLKNEWGVHSDAIRELFLTHYFSNFKPNFRRILESKLKTLGGYFSQDDFNKNREILSTFTLEGIQSATSKSGGVLKETPNHPFLDKIDAFTKLFTHQSLLAGSLPALNQLLEEKKNHAGLLTFDDLLNNLRDALLSEKGDFLAEEIRERFQAALIDEFQDTDPVQYEIFKRVFHNQRPLFFIGDPKQSIYQFRGADIFAYFKALDDASHKTHLTTNFRSDTKLIDAVNTLFSANPFRYEDKIPFIPSKSGKDESDDSAFRIEGEAQIPLKLWFLRSEEPVKAPEARSEIMASTVSEIVRLLNLGEQGNATIPGKKGGDGKAVPQPIKPSDIAILVLSHRIANDFQQALKKVNIPSVIRSKQTIFKTDEFLEVRDLLAGFYQYNRDSEIKKALLTELFDYTATEVYDLALEESNWDKIISSFRSFHEIWIKDGFYLMIRRFMKTESIREKMLQFEGGERKLTNYLQIFELLHKVVTEKQLNAVNLIKWMDQAKKHTDDEDEYQLRLETDEDALKILTVHVSKGLEFPIVFCPFSWTTRKNPEDILFHNPEENGKLTWDLLKKDESKRLEGEEALAEKVRLAYVAFTRAKHACYIAWGNINLTKSSCFAPLFHPKIENIDKVEGHLLWNDMEALEVASKGTIELLELPDANTQKFTRQETEEAKLETRKFDKNLKSNWRLYSFSSLSQMGKHEYQEEDDPKEPLVDTVVMEEVENEGILQFEGGAKTGNFFHEVMEDTDLANFSESEVDSLVSGKLKKYHFDESLKPSVIEVVEKVRTLPVYSDYETTPFSFHKIKSDQVIKEMEFYYPVNGLSLKNFISIVEKHRGVELHQSLVRTLKSLSFDPLKGFFKGFIDMVFCVGERYYILDWKTNTLGNKPSDYHKDNLKIQIEEHKFNLQYTLYTMALHKYLSKRMGEQYQFEKNFGGVYYFFLRGIDPAKPDHGVYYESLSESKEMFEELSHSFKGGAE